MSGGGGGTNATTPAGLPQAGNGQLGQTGTPGMNGMGNMSNGGMGGYPSAQWYQSAGVPNSYNNLSAYYNPTQANAALGANNYTYSPNYTGEAPEAYIFGGFPQGGGPTPYNPTGQGPNNEVPIYAPYTAPLPTTQNVQGSQNVFNQPLRAGIAMGGGGDVANPNSNYNTSLMYPGTSIPMYQIVGGGPNAMGFTGMPSNAMPGAAGMTQGYGGNQMGTSLAQLLQQAQMGGLGGFNLAGRSMGT